MQGVQEILLKKITDLEEELEALYAEYENSDYIYYAKHVALANKILKKSEELASLKNGLDLATA